MDTMLQKIFYDGRTHKDWLDKSVDDTLLQEAYNLARLGPTSVNCCPMRITFVKSPAAKEKLRPCLDAGNVDKTMKAPVTAIIAHDLEFYEHFSKLLPHADVRSWFAGNQQLIEDTAFRNGTLQGAYFIFAARSVGLDCGPMSGFDKALLDRVFFDNTSVRSNFLCNLGYGDVTKLHPRTPRFEFTEVCQIL